MTTTICRAKNPSQCRIHGNQATSVPELITNIKTEYPRAQIVLSQLNDILELDVISLPKELRGQGIGSKIMKQLTSYADQNNLSIRLTPDDVFGTSKQVLIDFYTKLGFTAKITNFHGYRVVESMIYRSSK